MDRLGHAKKLAESCKEPQSYICVEANGMCYGPDQFCDKEHKRIGECFDPEESEASHLQSCLENHGNPSSLKNAQCYGACSYRFNGISIDEPTEDPVGSNWELNAWFILSCLLMLALVGVCLGFYYWRRWKQSQFHSYQPDKMQSADDPESVKEPVIKPEMQRQLSRESQTTETHNETVDDAQPGENPPLAQQEDVLKDEAEETTPLTPSDASDALIQSVNVRQGEVGYGPVISGSHSNLSDGSGGSQGSVTQGGQSSSASTRNGPTSPFSLINQLPETNLNTAKNHEIVTNKTMHPINQ